MNKLRYVRFLVSAILLVCAFSIRPSSVSAITYGSNAYGTCTYSTCQQQHTVQSTPSGLQVAVNIAPEQVIPSTGFTIVITPLNGSGTTFKSVAVSIDNHLVATVSPDADGTARWKWDPVKYPGNTIMLAVTDTKGQITNFSFHVTIAVADVSAGRSSGGALSNVPDLPAVPTGLAGMIAQSLPGLRLWITDLPSAAVYAVPYLLLILVLIESVILWLLYQLEINRRSEATEYAAQSEAMIAQKRTFIELVSHHLRTPYTILQGGLDSAAAVPDRLSPFIATALERLRTAIEQIIITSEEAGGSAREFVSIGPGRFSVFIIAVLPALIIAAASLGFVYLANSYTAYQSGSFGYAGVVAGGVVLVTLVIFIVRRYGLAKESRRQAQMLVRQKQTLQAARDAVIEQIRTVLSEQVAALKQTLAGFDTAESKYASEGLRRLDELLKKVAIASRLKGAVSTGPIQDTTLGRLTALPSDLQQAAANKQIKVNLLSDVRYQTSSPDLLTFVALTLLENAVGYSPVAATIDISGRSQAAQMMSIEDHGTGIAPERQAGLFEPFYRAEGAESYTRDGVGLSLYLDKLIMNYLGGSIALSSQEGKGTVVAVTWPVL